MWSILLILALAAGTLNIIFGIKREKLSQLAWGIAIPGGVILLWCVLLFVTDKLWFDSLGQTDRFWTLFLAKWGCALTGGLFGALAMFILTLPIPKKPRYALAWPEALGAGVGILFFCLNWDAILLWLNGAATGTTDPILGKDISFYLFSFPFLGDVLYPFLIVLAMLSLITTTIYAIALADDHLSVLPVYKPFFAQLGALFLVIAVGNFLDRYDLLYSDWGAVKGAGWTDVHVRLPMYWVAGSLTALLGLVMFWASGSESLQRKLHEQLNVEGADALAFLIPPAAVLVLQLVFLGLVPGLFHIFAVSPNELAKERPYITNHIDFTRTAFRLQEGQIEEQVFPLSGELTPDLLERNQDLLSEVRLWDWRALDAVYKQFQEFRLYYEIPDVDIDRYSFGGRTRQVMVSARELEQDSLPDNVQNFVNLRLKFTHGYGVTMTPVSEFTPDGLPNLLVKDIPPQTSYPELEVTQPAIYFGELTGGQVYANSAEPELDYPQGDENVYGHYAGTGGTLLSSFFRRLAFSCRFDGLKLLISGYITPETRVLWRRNVRGRVQTLAPFLTLDSDPYLVLAGGKLYYFIDCYTTSSYYPYSKPLSGGPFSEKNYVRNSVKAVVDAYSGSVDFYIFDPDDPIIRAWQSILPGLFTPREKMPPELLAHIRYPEDFFLTQSVVYATYHMSSPDVFYGQEDLWVRATETYYGETRLVEPYYIMWQPPGSEKPEFAIILPFTPKEKQVSSGWTAGMCDPGNYGTFIAYKFPKDTKVPGPQQVESKIDQHEKLSPQLTLWDQRGSHVIRGNVLAIPIEDTLLYVEPIYLEAETAAYPELRLVVVMNGERLGYGKILNQALDGLFGETEQLEIPEAFAGATQEELGARANQLFEAYAALQSEGRFSEAGAQLEELRTVLRRLAGQPEPVPAEPQDK